MLQRLHETLGDEATNDLFSWWEEAATVNRTAVREVADQYFARFEAHLEKGLAEVRAEMQGGLAAVRSEMQVGLAEVRAEMQGGLAVVRSEMQVGLAAGRSEIVKGLAEVRAEMAGQRADLIKWMFIFWAGTVIPLAGLLIALTRLN